MPLLPDFEYLDIAMDDTSDITEDALLKLILYLTHGQRLKRVHFAFNRRR